MPTNLYGPGDNYDPSSSHVMPALIRRFHEAKQSAADSVTAGAQARIKEFLHADDLGEACVFAGTMVCSKSRLDNKGQHLAFLGVNRN